MLKVEKKKHTLVFHLEPVLFQTLTAVECYASMSHKIPERYLNDLQRLMELNDYQFLPELNQYRQEFDGGFRCVILTVTPYEEGLYLEAHLGVRIDAVEDMVYPLLNGLSSFKNHSMTLVTPLNKVVGEQNIREFAETAKDEDRLVAQIQIQLSRKGFSFLRQCSSIKALDELFNEHPLQKLTLVNNQYYRCFRGLVLAHLCNRNSFQELTAFYRSRLFREGAIEPIRDNFEKLVSFLQNYSSN